ncbi:hypothetical protein EV360DRAFT_86587 [Lentinula raphanica]|nr:hypothetical protein EV360DRAFT_86587 [Lentinula raphanica]
MNQTIHNLQEQMQMLMVENGRKLEASNKIISRMKAENAAVESRIVLLTNDNKEQMAHLTTELNYTQNSMSQHIQSQQIEYEELLQAFHELQTQRDSIIQEAEKLQRKNDELMNVVENAAMRYAQDITEKDSQILALKQNIEAVEDDHREAREKSLENHISLLQKASDVRLQSMSADLEKAISERDSLEKENADLREKNQTTLAFIAHTQSQENTATQLEYQLLKKLEDTIFRHNEDFVKRVLQDNIKETSDLRETNKALQLSLTERFMHNQTKCAELEVSIAISNMKNLSLNEEIVQAQANLQANLEEIKQLRLHELARTTQAIELLEEKNTESLQLQERILKLEETEKSLQEDVVSLRLCLLISQESRSKELEVKTREVNEAICARDKVEILLSENSELSQIKCAQLEKLVADTNLENRSLNEEIAQARVTFEETQTRLKDELARITQANEVLLEEKNTEFLQLQERILKLEETEKSLQEHVVSLRLCLLISQESRSKELELKTREVNEAICARDKLSENSEQSQIKCARLEKLVADTNLENRSLNEEIAQARVTLEETQTRLEDELARMAQANEVLLEEKSTKSLQLQERILKLEETEKSLQEHVVSLRLCLLISQESRSKELEVKTREVNEAICARDKLSENSEQSQIKCAQLEKLVADNNLENKSLNEEIAQARVTFEETQMRLHDELARITQVNEVLLEEKNTKSLQLQERILKLEETEKADCQCLQEHVVSLRLCLLKSRDEFLQKSRALLQKEVESVDLQETVKILEDRVTCFRLILSKTRGPPIEELQIYLSNLHQSLGLVCTKEHNNLKYLLELKSEECLRIQESLSVSLLEYKTLDGKLRRSQDKCTHLKEAVRVSNSNRKYLEEEIVCLWGSLVEAHQSRIKEEDEHSLSEKFQGIMDAESEDVERVILPITISSGTTQSSAVPTRDRKAALRELRTRVPRRDQETVVQELQLGGPDADRGQDADSIAQLDFKIASLRLDDPSNQTLDLETQRRLQPEFMNSDPELLTTSELPPPGCKLKHSISQSNIRETQTTPFRGLNRSIRSASVQVDRKLVAQRKYRLGSQAPNMAHTSKEVKGKGPV